MPIFLFSLLLLPFTSFAMTASDPSIVRILYGHAVPCQATWEANRPTFSLSDPAVQAEGGSASVAVTVNFALCVRNGEAVSLQPRLPLDPIDRKDDDGDAVQINYTNPEFYLGNAEYKELAVIQAVDANPQRVTLRFDLAKALTKAQQADLAAGKPVRARLVFLFRAIGRAFTKNGYTLLGQHSQGAFTVFFTLQK